MLLINLSDKSIKWKVPLELNKVTTIRCGIPNTKIATMKLLSETKKSKMPPMLGETPPQLKIEMKVLSLALNLAKLKPKDTSPELTQFSTTLESKEKLNMTTLLMLLKINLTLLLMPLTESTHFSMNSVNRLPLIMAMLP